MNRNDLVNVNERMFEIYYEHGYHSEEYQKGFREFLEVFKSVAIDCGEGAIAWENPYDFIMEGIADGYNQKHLKEALAEFKAMVDVLESINYSRLDRWKNDYEECVDVLNEYCS